MTKKKSRPLNTMSKKTAQTIAITSIVLVSILMITIIWFVLLQIETQEKQNQWRLQSCENMIEDYLKNKESWKWISIQDKKCYDN